MPDAALGVSTVGCRSREPLELRPRLVEVAQTQGTVVAIDLDRLGGRGTWGVCRRDEAAQDTV